MIFCPLNLNRCLIHSHNARTILTLFHLGLMTCSLTLSCFFKLTAVHLVDSHYCADPAKFISVLCTSLSTMLHVELPHVNVLSKMDLIEQYGKLGKLGAVGFTSHKILHETVNLLRNFFCLYICTAFNLDFYTEVMDLTYLLDHLAADPFFKKFHLLNEKLAEVIQDYSLVSFVPLNVQVSVKAIID